MLDYLLNAKALRNDTVGFWLADQSLPIMYFTSRALRDGDEDEKLRILIALRNLISMMKQSSHIIKDQVNKNAMYCDPILIIFRL